MSSIPYNYGSYIDAKVSMTDTGHVSAGKQIQSPASAGSRGLAKTTQFTNDRTQMQMGNSPIAESMVEIRNILNRIDGVNVPANEMNELADDDKIEYTKVMLDISAIKDRVEALSVDEDAKKSAIQSLTNAEEALVALDESAVREDDGLTQAYKQIAQLASDVDKNPEDAEDQWELASEVARPITKILKQIMDYDKGEQMPDGSDMSYPDVFKKVSMLANKGAQTNDPKMAAEIFKTMSSVYDMKQVAEESVSEDEDESYGYEWECSNCGTENQFDMTPQERAEYIKDWEEDNQDLVADGETGLDALNNLLDTGAESGMHYGQKCIKCGTDATNPYQNEDELSRLKELSGIREDTNDDLIQWAKKYSQYKNLEDDNLIEALYEYAFELGIAQLTFEVGELQAAERELGKKQEDWEDAEINAAMEMSPISNGLLDDLHRILPGNAELEQKLDSIRGMLQKAGLKEDKYQPFPEGDEMTFEDDDAFYEAFGELGFPEDETELFDAEYRGRKVPLNKPMRGDVKKFKVYVKDPKTGNVKKVNFGHGGSSARRAGQKTMKIRKSNPKARKSFRARHNCANPGPKTKARYWSCRKW
jgi:hypothetical protein